MWLVTTGWWKYLIIPSPKQVLQDGAGYNGTPCAPSFYKPPNFLTNLV